MFLLKLQVTEAATFNTVCGSQPTCHGRATRSLCLCLKLQLHFLFQQRVSRPFNLSESKMLVSLCKLTPLFLVRQ